MMGCVFASYSCSLNVFRRLFPKSLGKRKTCSHNTANTLHHAKQKGEQSMPLFSGSKDRDSSGLLGAHRNKACIRTLVVKINLPNRTG